MHITRYAAATSLALLLTACGVQADDTSAPAAPASESPAGVDGDFALNGQYATDYPDDSPAVVAALEELNTALDLADFELIDAACGDLIATSRTWGDHAPSTVAGDYIRQAADAYVEAGQACLRLDFEVAADALERGGNYTQRATDALDASMPG